MCVYTGRSTERWITGAQYNLGEKKGLKYSKHGRSAQAEKHKFDPRGLQSQTSAAYFHREFLEPHSVFKHLSST